MKKLVLLSAVMMLCVASPAWAALSLYSTNNGSVINVFATGSDSISYVGLGVNIGGNSVDADHKTGGPRIADIVFNPVFGQWNWTDSGLIYQDIVGAGTNYGDGMSALRSFDSATSTPVTWQDFPLATVTLDTHGVAAGTEWSVDFLGSSVNSATGGSQDMAFTAGSVQVVPEPATMAMLLSLVVAVPVMVWRRRKVA